MNRVESERGRRRWPLGMFLAVAALLILFGFLTLLSIGILVLPVGIAMVVAASFWDRPWLVAAIAAGAVAFSTAYALTAPLGCTQTVLLDGRPRVTTMCSRAVLPDLPRSATGRDSALAFGFAGLAAAVVGVGSARLSRRLGKRGTWTAG